MRLIIIDDLSTAVLVANASKRGEPRFETNHVNNRAALASITGDWHWLQRLSSRLLAASAKLIVHYICFVKYISYM